MGVRSKMRGAWTAAWSKASPVRSYKCGEDTIKVRTTHWNTRVIANWEAGWKSELIGSVLASRPGGLLDVGVNVGQTLLDYLCCKSRRYYIGFEPNSICVIQAQEIINANDLAEECSIIPVGLSDENTVVPLHITSLGASDSGASMIRNVQPGVFKASTQIPVHRLDDIGAVVGDRDVALIKIDVEGAESHTLRGAKEFIAVKRPWILCEVLHRDKDASHSEYLARCRSVSSILSELDYRIANLEQSKDFSTIASVTAVSEFPDEVYRESSRHRCDYLFVPSSEIEAVPHVLGLG